MDLLSGREEDGIGEEYFHFFFIVPWRCLGYHKGLLFSTHPIVSEGRQRHRLTDWMIVFDWMTG